MKLASVLFILILQFSLSLNLLAAEDPPNPPLPAREKIDAFCSTLGKYVESKDFNGIRSLYYAEGTPAEYLEDKIRFWKLCISPTEGMTFDKIEYSTLYQYRRLSENVSAESLKQEERGDILYNELPYTSNIPLTSIITVYYRKGGKRGGFVFHLGVDPSGEIKLPGITKK